MSELLYSVIYNVWLLLDNGDRWANSTDRAVINNVYMTALVLRTYIALVID